MCAVFSTYSRDCATRGVHLTAWREGICGMYSIKNTYMCTGEHLQQCYAILCLHTKGISILEIG